MDKLDAMRAFVKVVQHNSFSEAARELRLSRSAVSKSVNELEKDLGVQLLNRTTRTASPTEQGLIYFERSKNILAEIDDAERDLSSRQKAPRGLLRVNAPMSFGTLHLSRALSDLMQRYPELRIQLVLSDEMIDPVQDGLDLTLRIGELPSSSLVARKIVPIKRVLCAAPAYLEKRGTPRHPNELRDHDCLAYGYLATGNQWKLTSAGVDHWIQVPWSLCSNNAEVLRQVAVAGCGIALLPTFIAGADLQEGALRTILSDYQAPPLSLYALYPPTKNLSTKIRVFIDFMVERFGGKPYWDLIE
jgi:DNA-binding transcriptional LysR family regulator